MTEKPTLESRLLHLYTPGGKESGYVILLDKDGVNVGGIFDLKNPNEKEKLTSLFNYTYQTSEERLKFFYDQAAQEEADRYNNARKTSLANYSGGIFHRDDFYEDYSILADKLKNDFPPKYVWASKKVRLERIWAKDIWERIGEDVVDFPPCVPGSDDLLNDALKEFFTTNEDKLAIDIIDYSLAVLV